MVKTVALNIEKVNPSMLPKVDKILKKYSGREEDMFRKLEEKYGIRIEL